MKKHNRILFSLIAPVVCENAECKMQDPKCGAIKRDAELDEKTLASVYALAKRHDLGHLLSSAVRKNAKCKMQNAESEKASHSGRGVSIADGEGVSEHRAVVDGAATPKHTGLVSELEKTELTAVWRVRNIENEQGRVRKCLEDSKIPFVLLKGAVLRSYYPEPWMRTSSDIDVLVPRDMLDVAVKAVTDALGYRVSTVEPHDASLYAKSGVHLDMHTLFEGDREDGRQLDAAWQDAYTDGGCEHFLTPEHFYFYHVAHMAEHMRNGGCGIRPFIDLYLINSRLDFDREKLDLLLTEYGLARFENAAARLSEAWMLGLDRGDLAPLEEYVLTGGVYGTTEQSVAAKRRDGRGKLGYVVHRIFMPYSELKERHKALDGRPWLTPFFEVYRWCSLIVPSRLKRSRAELRGVATVDSDRVASVNELFNSLGI